MCKKLILVLFEAVKRDLSWGTEEKREEISSEQAFSGPENFQSKNHVYGWPNSEIQLFVFKEVGYNDPICYWFHKKAMVFHETRSQKCDN
jgi:hypothetical protein